MNKEYDLIIVGSGAGGATVASRLAPLAKQGVRIALLEAGPHFSNRYFTQREIEMFDLFYDRGAWPTADGAVTVSFGKAVGGSTLMYTGVTFRLPDDVCRQWGVEGLTPEDLAPRFARLEKEVNVMTPGPEMVNENNRLFRKGCEALDLPVKDIQLNLDGCEQMGFCNLGCVRHHKQGTAAVQVPQAVAAGVELVPNCEVRRIAGHTLEATVKSTPPGTEPGPWSPGEYRISARQIVLAGGTVGSTALLLRSGFERELPALGKYVTIHPAMTVYGIHPQKVEAFRGFPKVYYTDAFSEKEGFYLETAFYYPFITAKNTALWGTELTHVMQRYDRLMGIIILAHDEALATNRIRLDSKGLPQLKYQLSERSIEALCDGQRRASRIFFAAGCEQVVMPNARQILFGPNATDELDSFISPRHFLPNKTPIASAHLQGGCRMGQGPEDSVCDSRGRVHGHPHLFVADGSLFPQSAHVNPYLTIMALADRVAEGVVA
ncbi:MAG: GMC family oxidoreductase [Saprospiraceae bacterium]|nr:GMC family oxidoreductase [Saprospiraceae bacterium]MCB0681428.1 GMC family oxidoreductase [Saprospiraceae bacterium]